jgi:hypothetical protein
VNETQQYKVKFIVDAAFIEQMKQYAHEHPNNLKIESEKTEKDATKLGFDLVTVASIVTIVSGTLYIGELAAKILGWLSHSSGNKVAIQTPFQTIEIHRSANLTERDVRGLLKAAMEISSK